MSDPVGEDTDIAQLLTDSGKEQIKLHANFINGIAIATFAVGTLAPLTRAIIDDTISRGAVAGLVVLAAVCFVVAGVLHSYAYRHLKGLDQ